jgi:hypothetical protein
MVFLNIEKAFDRVWHEEPIKKVIVDKFPENLVHCCNHFFATGHLL